MKEIGAIRTTYGRVLILTALLGIIGWAVSVYAGDWLNTNGGWFFNGVAGLLFFLPQSYKQGSFVAQWGVYGLWFLLGGLVLTLFFRRGRSSGSSKSGPPSRRH